MRIIRRSLFDKLPDLDLGAGKQPKAALSLDLSKKCRPNIVADIQQLPLRSESVSSIICSHTIEHAKESKEAMSEIRRILRKNGTLILFVPDDESMFWRIIRPLWSVYYQRAVSSENSPKAHMSSFSCQTLKDSLERFFTMLELGKINLGMEIYAVCKRHQ